MAMSNLKFDLTGQTFGKLTAISHAGRGHWNVRCECGVEKVVPGGNLRRTDGKATKACGTCGPSHLNSGEGHTRWQGDRIAYATAHKRITVARGRARDHACAICGDQAASWAYRGGSPKELREWRESSPVKRGWLRYSPDPDDYDPLCWTCHARKDVIEARARVNTP